MSRTIQEVKDGLALEKQRTQALIAQSNATTGKEDTTLTNAVNSLVEGYGQGESSGIASGSFTPTEPLLEIEIDVGFDFSHIIITLDDISYSTGNGHKTFNHAYFDAEKKCTLFVSTNNAGTSNAGYVNPDTTQFLKKEKLLIYSGSTAGNTPGYLEPYKYNWYAW